MSESFIVQSAPVITQEHINRIMDNATHASMKMGEKTTVVCVRLPSGFEMIESSACINPANYNHDLGTELALKKVEDRLWELEGYRLQCEVANAC